MNRAATAQLYHLDINTGYPHIYEACSDGEPYLQQISDASAIKKDPFNSTGKFGCGSNGVLLQRAKQSSSQLGVDESDEQDLLLELFKRPDFKHMGG